MRFFAHVEPILTALRLSAIIKLESESVVAYTLVL